MSNKDNEQQLQQDLINFMFLGNDAGNLDAMACLSLWFGKSQDTDTEIRKKYGDMVWVGDHLLMPVL